MGKLSGIINNQLCNNKITQKKGNTLNLNKNKIYQNETTMSEKPLSNLAKLLLSGNTKSFQTEGFYPSSYINNKKIATKIPRKNSDGTEGTSTDDGSNEKRDTKNICQKTNKNKNPFKCEAKDFKIKYKTELCKYYEINGYCKYGDKCAYAHGKENLRSKVTNTTAYRTKKCTQFFEQGYCPYGNRCQFAHQLKSNIINNPYDKGMSYGKMLETISKLENVENIKKLVEKPRLPAFQAICDNKQNTKSRLLDDIKNLSYNNLYKRINY